MRSKVFSIHQFTPSIADGDGVSGGVLWTADILRGFGFNSLVYANHIDPKLKDKVLHIDSYVPSPDNVLIYHHSIGHEHHEQILAFADKKILCYHNITPSHFFNNSPHLQQACDLGRKQLASSAKAFVASYADSEYNAKELHAFGYQNPKPIPLLVDITKKNLIRPNETIIKNYSKTFTILFVGRIVSNKSQEMLIETIYYLKKLLSLKLKLILVGSTSEQAYFDYLKKLVVSLKLEDSVLFAGKVSQEDLAAYYSAADIYLSLSDHEGFSIPIIEALSYDTLTIAYSTCALPDTLGEQGTIDFKSPDLVAKYIYDIINDPSLRANILKRQKRHFLKFHQDNLKKNFADFLTAVDIDIPNYPSSVKSFSDKTIRIEGSFDSSYSLAIVNKTIAKALGKQGCNVKLYSTEGFGDFEPNLSYISDLDILGMYENTQEFVNTTIRNLYPPRTNAMQGENKIIGPYGWEESVFPKEYVDFFNARLTTIFAMSEYVKKVLKNSGVCVPIVTTGIVADDIIETPSQKLDFELPHGFRLLHISSAFPRKGIDKLLEAFELLDESFSIILKIFPNPHNNAIEQLLNIGYILTKTLQEGVFLYVKENKTILCINKDLKKEQIRYLYENSNLLVAPSFGEGFGLPMAEAMLCNLPVLTTGYGGQTDFCNDAASWLIDFDFAVASTHLSEPNSIWAVPKVSHLAYQIKKISQTLSNEIKVKTDFAREIILKNYSKEAVAAKILSAINSSDSPVIASEARQSSLPSTILPRHSVPRSDCFSSLQSSLPVIASEARQSALLRGNPSIGVFSTYNTKCGIAIYTKNLISSFVDKTVIFANYTQEPTVADDPNIVRCWHSGRDTSDIEALKSAIVSKNITTLIIQYNFSFIPLYLLEELLFFCNLNSIDVHLFFHSTKDVITAEYIDSIGSISKSVEKTTAIYVHSVEDLNYLKHFGVYKNTFLIVHPFNAALMDMSKHIQKVSSDFVTLATFGFLLPQKGVLELIDVAEELDKEGIKVKLLLLCAIHPAPVSQILKKRIEEKISSSPIKNRIEICFDFLPEEQIVARLSAADKIVFAYQNTQESSSAALRIGLLSQKEIIATPQPIFNDAKHTVTFSSDSSVASLVKTIKKSLSSEFDPSKQIEWILKNDIKTVSQRFFNSL
ncbi:MAG: glycosyltransferase [Sulfurimonas sp.]|uniref:glycosyltransferase n=1 Tax=Sulfurimonas sp. TaxID=2022749 RepID=UPI002607674B|nr:glycosyltransferase [Sulfurimonas sp.]MDD5399885.1 glycosyltransferase [Sulfurimonas sp.]